MKKLLPFALTLLCLGVVAPAHAQNGAPTSQKEKLSYALGMNFAQTMKSRGVEIDPGMFDAAVRDVLAGNKLQMTQDQTRAVFEAADREMQTKQQSAMKPVIDKNKATGAAFLTANKVKDGVKTLPDGLQYKVLAEGSGPTPKATDTVTVKYRGTLIDGTEFDASDKHGGTASFPVNGVIPGWTEALQKMNVGSKWQLFLPSDLAYGDRGTPDGSIQPGSTLLFDVELVKIGQ